MPRAWIYDDRDLLNSETCILFIRSDIFCVYSNNNNADYEIMVYEPKVYEDSLPMSAKLREGNPVIINLQYLEPTEGTRLIDFVCGTAYAIDGHMIKIGESIFLFTPNNIVIADLAERDSISSDIEESSDAARRSFFGGR